MFLEWGTLGGISILAVQLSFIFQRLDDARSVSTLSATAEIKRDPPRILFYFGGAGCVDGPTGSTKSQLDFGRCSPAATVRSEAEDERPSPAASNPTLSATHLFRGLPLKATEVSLLCSKLPGKVAATTGPVEFVPNG